MSENISKDTHMHLLGNFTTLRDELRDLRADVGRELGSDAARGVTMAIAVVNTRLLQLRDGIITPPLPGREGGPLVRRDDAPGAEQDGLRPPKPGPDFLKTVG